MKLKQLLTKTLLVAVGLGMGASAWADDYASVYSRATVSDWTSEGDGNDATAWGTSVSATDGLGVNGNTTFTATNTFTVHANAKIKYELDWYFGSSVGNNANFTWIQFGDKVRLSWGNYYQLFVSKTGVSSREDSNPFTGGNSNYVKHISIIFNTATKTVESFTFDGNDYSSYVSGVLEGDFNKISFGFTRGGSVSWIVPSFIKTLVVSECEQEVTIKDYEINYKFGDDVVKNVSGSSAVGATINAELPLTVAGQKYFAADAATTSLTISADGSNVLNVDLRKANEYAYSVKDNFNTVIASGTYVEGEDAVNAYWPKYVNNAGSWYVCDEASFGISISGAVDKVVNYSSADITYFVEGESMNGYAAVGTKSGVAYSGGLTGRSGGTGVWYTDGMAEGGVYTITFPYERIANSSGSTLNLSVRASDGSTKLIEAAALTAASGTYEVTDVIIPEGSGFQIAATGSNSNYGIDYVILTRTGDATYPVEITSAGWATLYTPYALDFSSLSSELTAYTATVADGVVTLTETTEVPANSGVVLKGEEDTYNVPVIASSAADGGDLQGSATEAQGIDEEYDYYMLALNGENAQFRKLASGTIAAGKAFLKIAKGAGAPVLSIVFGNSSTGIETVKSLQPVAGNAVYNLNGQRIAQPTKGLYIVGGKKVVLK